MNNRIPNEPRRWIKQLVWVVMLVMSFPVFATDDPEKITLSMRDVQLAEVMAMLARQERTNILLADDVEAKVSFNLYDVSLHEAIRSIANAAGFAVEYYDGNYLIVDPEETGKHVPDGLTQLQTFELEYAQIEGVESVLSPYLSRYGKLTTFPNRRLVMIEDTPLFLKRIGALIWDLDQQPKQIMIEAKILEITLSDEESYGINWAKLFQSDGGTGSFGTQGLAGSGGSNSAGFFFDYTTPNFDIAINVLEEKGRVRTLSTPKLLALENQEASVIIGDRRGFPVTTTINQVTTESIEFLESGVILRVTPSVDKNGQVLLDIHPEVSTGSIDPNTGIPSQTTTEVTTQMIVRGGDTIFIGGLMKHVLDEATQRVPVLGRIPVVRRLFSSKKQTNLRTETVVLITPHVIDKAYSQITQDPAKKASHVGALHQRSAREIDQELDDYFSKTVLPDVKTNSEDSTRNDHHETSEGPSSPSLRLSRELNASAEQ